MPAFEAGKPAAMTAFRVACDNARAFVLAHGMFLTFMLATSAQAAAPQAPERAAYSPAEAFAPLTLPDPASPTRSASGAPGASYWQNRADYQIHAILDPAAKRISGTVVISYTNNSPDALGALWLQLDQNIYRADSRSGFTGMWPRDHVTAGFELDRVEVGTNGHFTRADHIVTDTRMQVRLPDALRGGGGKLQLRIAYHYSIPGKWGGRTGWDTAREGEIYDIAQWYPRMAVYDDLRGWDTLPYLGNEFYLEYGDFDYYVTAPADMLVAGSGELQNPGEVLTAVQQARLAQARRSDSTVMIRSPSEVGDPSSRPRTGATLTWHYRMPNTRDVAFAASRSFAWDAARINLPDGKTSLAMSFYPAESAGAAAWGRSTEYLKHAVEEYSRRWFPYPWPAAINVAGPAAGIEYPGIVFDGVGDKGKRLFWITAHEIGHSWFPMIVGFDERRDAWMDEGFNTFIDVYESDAFNHGEYAPKRDSEYAGGGGNPVDEIVPLLADPDAPVILSRADTITFPYSHPVSYFKSALGLVLLREQILGPERFDWAFRRFIRNWAYRHPTPSDFFRAMNSDGGEDLSWWWRGWYFTNSTLDLAVTGISYVDGDPARGADIHVANLDPLVMPAILEVRYADGSTRRIRLPAESWIQRRETTVHVDGAKAIIEAIIDPDHVLPDHDRSNNRVGVSSRPHH